MSSEKRDLNQKQRRILIGVALALLIAVISGGATMCSPHRPNTQKDGPIPTYTGHLRADQFKHPHPDEDITTDAA